MLIRLDQYWSVVSYFLFFSLVNVLKNLLIFGHSEPHVLMSHVLIKKHKFTLFFINCSLPRHCDIGRLGIINNTILGQEKVGLPAGDCQRCEAHGAETHGGLDYWKREELHYPSPGRRSPEEVHF